MRVEATKAFLRDLKKLSKADALATTTALQEFVQGQTGKRPNFEPVVGRPGYYTIRGLILSACCFGRLGKTAST